VHDVDDELLRALGSRSRARVLAELRAADGPLDAQELGHRLGLHPNTVRSHLDLLEDAGLVTSESAPPHGRGRPRIRFHAVEKAAAAGPRLLADLLDRLGFAAELANGNGSPLVLMRRCPIRDLVRTQGHAACDAHLGMIRGALAAIGTDVEAAALEPFVEPGLCVLRLERRTP
jgi:predicted ArsR family transcriptional regulator